jgi:hydroxymethylglutaryl-CoA reductase (NADPH)
MGMDYVDALKRGRIKPYELEMKIWEEKYKRKKEEWSSACMEASEIRLKFLEEKLKVKLDGIRKCYIDASNGKKLTTGIEQKIGSIAVPLGVAGPLNVNGGFARGEFYLPVATNEAALVAGLNRGCRVINKAGGVNVRVIRDSMARSPLIETPDIEKAGELAERLITKDDIYKRIKAACESESNVSRLIDIQPFQFGRYLHIRFVFQTGDSMGMNSATKYAANGIRELIKNYPWVKLVSLTGNMCSDKKASHINVLFGRGKSVETEVTIPVNVVKDVFGVETEDIVKLNHLKNYAGSSLGGTLTGFNANVANTIAAMFIATGQDAAQIVESSSCFTRAEMVRGKLLFGLSLPCLEVATTGGGTDYGTAKECLDILGCYGYGSPPGRNAKKLAEIIAAAATAQDLNLMMTECNQYELAESHIRLARGR